MCNKVRNFSSLSLVLLTLLVLDLTAMAQTPWETAPARPAPLPATRPTMPPPTKLVDLPPPPASRTSPSANMPAGPTSLIPDELGGLPNSTSPSTAVPGGDVGSRPGTATDATLPRITGALPMVASPTSPPLLDLGNIPPPNLVLPALNNSVVDSPISDRMNNRLPSNTGSLAAYPSQRSMQNANQPPAPSEFQPGELIAVVGTEHILAGDMNVFIDPIIEKNRAQIRNAEQEKEIRTQLTRQVLEQYVEVKAMYQEFFRDMVGTAVPKELEDTKKQVLTRAGKIFYEKQVPHMMEQYKVSDIAALEYALREKSMSLNTKRTQFVEQVLAGELERKYVPEEFEIDRNEILDAYNRDREKWQVPARRWRQITIRFDKHESRQVADELIKNLGDQMVLGGKPFEAVAKQSSEGFTADQGGLYDWTSQGSLKSQRIDAAIFAIELNRLSQIIEDDIGLHIIEVLEREQAHTKDLAESQAEIRESLNKVKRDEAAAKFRKAVMKRTPIWTRWPEDIPGSRPLSQAIGP
ncbi:MAG: peptidylprolyl isomerase [Pirellulaceae bacterium]